MRPPEREFPFGGIPVYNPQSLSRDEAIAQFHARRPLYESLIALLRQEHPSHVLIIGTRGMGKTTLLQRVRYGVEGDHDLNRRYLPLVFPEEQYNVNRLHHFLLNAVDALADAMERLQDDAAVSRIEAFTAETARRSPEQIEQEVPQFLADFTAEKQRSLLLLVDNADRLFDTIEDSQQWRLRDLLSVRSDLTFIGATTQASEGLYGPGRAFFEFFRIQQLTPLSVAEVRDLLLHLSDQVDEKPAEKGSARRRVAAWLDEAPGRLETLVQLTGGNPRTAVLLFHLVLDGLTGDAREYLEQLLDQVTPTYKGRVDELPAQAQQVLDAVALHWDPVTASRIASQTGLETGVVSAQLTRLLRQGVLEKADPGDSKRVLYQVAERFFNIWYLMRASRRVRARLRWFVEFLRVFFQKDELQRIGLDRLRTSRDIWRTRPEELENVFAYLYAAGTKRGIIEKHLRIHCPEIESDLRPYLEAIQEPKRRRSPKAGAPKPPTESEIRRAIAANPEDANLWLGLGWLLMNKPESQQEAESALRRSIDLEPSLAWGWGNLGRLLMRIGSRRGEAEFAFRKAVAQEPEEPLFREALGMLLLQDDRLEDGIESLRKAVELDPRDADVWGNLGLALSRLRGCAREAEEAAHKATQLCRDAAHLRSLAIVLGRTRQDTAEAESVIKRAIEREPENALFWNDLGDLVARDPERHTDAEAAYRRATELNPSDPWYWGDLGDLLITTHERDAVTALRKAIELDPQVSWFWAGLATALILSGDLGEEPEAAARKAIELNRGSSHSWVLLAILLTVHDRQEEAEAAARKAIELDPLNATSWNLLGKLLDPEQGRLEEAESAYRRATEILPEDAGNWADLATLLAGRGGRPAEAEQALRRALDLKPHHQGVLRQLGVLLYSQWSPAKGMECLRQAVEKDTTEPISAAIYTAAVRLSAGAGPGLSPWWLSIADEPELWDDLLITCRRYPPFATLLRAICDLVAERSPANSFVPMFRAMALAEISDFPRASVAFEDALTGDPIELLATARDAIELFLTAAVQAGRAQEALAAIEKKGWQDAWRPIYDALKAVEAGNADYLKRVAVEIRDLAQIMLRRIAPQLPGLASSTVKPKPGQPA
jgi:Flp pilus assembly protein TadD